MLDSRSALAVARSSSFLTGIEPAAVQTILSAAQVRRMSAKDNIITGGHRASHMFLVQSGRVRYYHLTKHGEVVLLAWLVPADVIGLVALLKTQSTYMATAEAASDCELLSWDHAAIRKLASRYPLLGENALNIALEYVRAYIGRHVGLVTKTAEERLANTLLHLSDKSGEVHSDGIEIRATNDELGALADISPFTTSRLVSSWARAGTVSKGRGRILLHDPEALMIE
jgi:CRP/FNR family transcriptional regulator, nitrogen oxide reductase regulator